MAVWLESAKAACEDKPEPERADGHVIVIPAVLLSSSERSRGSVEPAQLSLLPIGDPGRHMASQL